MDPLFRSIADDAPKPLPEEQSGHAPVSSDPLSTIDNDKAKEAVLDRATGDPSLKPYLLPDERTSDQTGTNIFGSLRNVYRILELINEQGSDGLVDKIIIAQSSLRAFVNDLSPNAYASLTKVDFKALDLKVLKPVGIYGLKKGIVDFMVDSEIIDSATANALMSMKDESQNGEFQSGLYVARAPLRRGIDAEQVFILYWPEDTTWNDDAPSSVRRNRITFMRYLTKIVDQTYCLLPGNEGSTIVWDEDDGLYDAGAEPDDEQTDRLFSFEVAKTLEQVEDVTTRHGFDFQLPCEQPTEEGRSLQRIPRLLAGETTQGFMAAKLLPPTELNNRFDRKDFNPTRLHHYLETGSIVISPALGGEAFSALMEDGLSRRSPQISRVWKEKMKALDDEIQAMRHSQKQEFEKSSKAGALGLKHALLVEASRRAQHLYPYCDFPVLDTGSSEMRDLDIEQGSPAVLKEKGEEDLSGSFMLINWLEVILADDGFSKHVTLYPAIKEDFEKAFQGLKWKVTSKDFQSYKSQLVGAWICLNETDKPLDPENRRILLTEILDDPNPTATKTSKTWWFNSVSKLVPALFGESSNSESQTLPTRVRKACHQLSDPEFLAKATAMARSVQEPLLDNAIQMTLQLANSHYQADIEKFADDLSRSSMRIQGRVCDAQIERDCHNHREVSIQQIRSMVLEEYRDELETNDPRTIHLEDIKVSKNYRQVISSYMVTVQEHTKIPPLVEYKIHPFHLPIEHRHNLQLDPKFIPSPQINWRSSYAFQLPESHAVLHAQLLADDKILLVVDDQQNLLSVYLDSLSNIGRAVTQNSTRKTIHKEKTGPEIRISFDEGQRMLALFATAKFSLHVFVFDENFNSLRSWAHPISLVTWYESGKSIEQICFVCGKEEVLLVDNDAQARIFSLVAQQCRPATLVLPDVPKNILSSPDGSCFLAVFSTDGSLAVRAYHWTTFGSTEGIPLGLDLNQQQNMSLTSFVNKSTVHLLCLDPLVGQCRSVVLDITKKSTEFTFQEKFSSLAYNNIKSTTVHNCLLDCHSDVWTRFPVVPAVSRETIFSSVPRQPKWITFITEGNHDHYSSYFSRMIREFEQRTRKPTGNELRSINIGAITYQSFKDGFSQPKQVSRFLAGEWLVNLLCLIPIHIAVTRENRFVPLKDGVTSSEFETSLLGAEISTVVDSISFGWYESILQSYLAKMPVKVVSSMGEQSVGKSYALNHLVDTSFAGSAMRTTEGVWMSVTPTDAELIVALDFEGVHSIERSAQEDTLLVLFNTAISNFVLFRNNFALSRDITGLFQSFQSSSSVFDPAVNPGLFQSTLAIIIKDVVDSDKREIVREFSLKFQRIVQDEQDSNFISRLHHGQLDIIPWPVIESKHFYTLFPILKRKLDRQITTHANAGQFLHTLKTLMAKLKANDWRAMSQSMAAHRAHQLLLMLPNALAYGNASIDPEVEPLKDLDTDTDLATQDSPAHFYLTSLKTITTNREQCLKDLCQTWNEYGDRPEKDEIEWFDGLVFYLRHLLEMRIQHVQAWISSNLANFKATHDSITSLHRTLEAMIIDAKANAELCKQQCSSCQLLCLLGSRHDASEPHHCQTSHKCLKQCDFSDEHPSDLLQCGYPAGHNGKHVCVVDAHLCGERCLLEDKNGCLGECTKIAGHVDDDHRCSARKHACGQPCELVVLDNEKAQMMVVYQCPETCTISSDTDHEHHICDHRLCPMKCGLCGRLCSSTNHLHALSHDAVHLCGEIHPCSSLCAASGICEIDTAPHSIEATFSGRHENFQYTKYSQVAKRLKCAIPIPSMQLSHPGSHSHSTESLPFHFCETRCHYCGYYCTLPRGHPQQEHETSHGSMSKTRWALERPDDVLELSGRKFGSNDEGAPMMCNLYCKEMGRHVHIDFCRADAPESCNGQDLEHIRQRMNPDPNNPKDWITHELYWKRSGFKDPYSREDRVAFAKCDSMCSGPEHQSTPTNQVQHSYCALPMFHVPHRTDQLTGLGYVSNDGHMFSCKNPSVMQQAFHVIFVIDRSGSMSSGDRRPLPGTPVTATISRHSDNRLGAVYSSLHAFWSSRQAIVAANKTGNVATTRRDSYSVILFDHTIAKCISNDFAGTPEALLNQVLRYRAGGGTNYSLALRSAEEAMRLHWSTERAPLVIFLSDGECSVTDEETRTLCRAAVALGKPLSFQGVAFGPSNHILRRMAHVAHEIQTTAPRDPLVPAAAMVDSAFHEALDSIRLAETFLGIADSLKKPRGALFA